MVAAAKKIEVPEQVRAASIDVAKVQSDTPTEAALQTIVRTTGKSYFELMREFGSLAFGPGRVSFRDYVRLRLFDDAFYAQSDKRTVVGQRRNRDISVAVNYRIDWYGLLENKVTSLGYLAAYGLPIIPCVALYGENLDIKTPTIARNRQELRDFLVRQDLYPLFGKPTEAFQSLGSIALKRYSPGDDRLERVDGSRIALDDFLADISQNYANGYLFQKFVEPHPSVRAMCGTRLATVRVVTIRTADGPKVFRASWKIPAGANSADNYWRSGNLLAQIDLAQGRIVRALSGAGVDLVTVTHHPDTGASLAGAVVPHWDAITGTALAGAKLLQHVPMIGWDIAPVENGAVIVEMNETPDFFLHQLADGRGVLDPEFQAFMAYQERNAKAHEKRMRTNINKL